MSNLNIHSSQIKAILQALQSGQTITPLDALRQFGCFRLGARIWDLKNQGHPIQSEMIQINGKRMAQYSYKPAA